MIQQESLDQFGWYPIPASPPSDKFYYVGLVKGRWTCRDKDWKPCEHFRRHGGKGLFCRHILEHLWKSGLQVRKYLDDRKRFPSQAAFESFERALACTNWTRDSEANYLCNLVLALAYSNGEVTSDDIYETIQGEFAKSGSIMGRVFAFLNRNKLIKPKPKNIVCAHCGKSMVVPGCIERVPSRTPTNHGAEIKIWILGENGYKLAPEFWGL